MRIGIDASNLRAGGGVTHLVELLRAANPRAHGFNEVIVWGGAATLLKVENREWLRKIHDTALDRSLPYRVCWQRFKLNKLAREAGCDVLFVPGGSDASGFAPMVTMSRNMLPFEWHEMRRYGFSWNFFKNMLLHWTQTRTFRRADGLIFLTQYARDTVMSFVGLRRGSETIIPHGVDEGFFSSPRAQRGRSDFTAESPCRLLYVSHVDVYKHQWHVAQAVARLRTSGMPVVLDLVGPASPAALKRLNGILRSVDPNSIFIRYRGAVPHEDLNDLYAAADISIFASSCENMPNILLESMASGLPIACSKRGPMPEVLGECGLYFDPEKPEEIFQVIRRFIESPELRAEKARFALERARQYSWKRCAMETFSYIAATASAA